MIGDPYPLAGAIAASALERRESRGGHRRVDAPGLDHSLDGTHFILDAAGRIRREAWR